MFFDASDTTVAALSRMGFGLEKNRRNAWRHDPVQTTRTSWYHTLSFGEEEIDAAAQLKKSFSLSAIV